MKDNVVLIGMPGVGKSSAGVVLAKLLGYDFVDSDLVIQQKDGRLLKDIIAEDGNDTFLQIENHVNSEIDVHKSVIATGGSVIYGEDAMKHLAEIGTIVYLRASYRTVNQRISNIVGRGVAIKKNQTLKDLYNERIVLYEKYSDIKVDVDKMTISQTVNKILQMFH